MEEDTDMDSIFVPQNTDQWNIPEDLLEDLKQWQEALYKCFK